ncbi:MAG: GNAT family N-acetyltransferase [Ruthenibacterium sp.]
MIVRKLHANEKYKAALGMAVAFEWDMDFEKEKQVAQAMTLQEVEKADAARPPLPSGALQTERWGAFAPDNTTLLGSFGLAHYPVRFEGHEVMMGGIGGVATLPQYRRCGAIRACLQAAMQEMNEKGFVLSFLYPFSRSYYRKFGYENGALACTWTIPFSTLRLPRATGHMVQLLPGDSTAPLLQIYNTFYAKYNNSVIRTVFDSLLETENTLAQKRYLYVWYNEAMQPRGFLIFHKKEGIMDCTTTFEAKNAFLFLDCEALTALLDFASTAFAADYHAIRFTLPEEIHIDSFIAEGNEIQRSVGYNGMMRIVNVQHALQLCRCMGEGSIRIAVSDEIAPWNEETWQLDFAPERANIVQKTLNAPDVALSVNDFSALICGTRCAEDFAYMPQVQIYKHDAPFDKVFYRKPNYVLNLF